MNQPNSLGIPPLAQIPAYTSDLAALEPALLRFLDYRQNKRNLESFCYGAQNVTLTGLDRDCSSITTFPQYSLNYSRTEARAIVADLVEQAKNRSQPTASASQRTSQRLSQRSITGAGADDPQQPRSSPGSEGATDEGGDTNDEREDEFQLGSLVDAGYETEEEDLKDNISIMSMHTETENHSVEGFPDFVWTHTTMIDMPTDAGNGPVKKPKAETEEHKRQRLWKQASQIYGGKLLRRVVVSLIEEDKKGASRRLFFHPDTNKLEEACELLLRLAEKELRLYMFMYFFLIDRHAKEVVCRATSGVHWRWASFDRSEIPLHYFPSTDGPLKPVQHIASEAAKTQANQEKWSVQPVYTLGTAASDAALTAMRAKVIAIIVARG
ncbi:hypothetical protein BD626DRAFT_562829 [Schizophyllum amplum]|uniref:Uncharacterized protein n=1 Tax=Schizophyllum amplum TaxID=97359 RepID=A0A550CW49_9AGAR|nr:hypothetical protein BD626DRAFT_562829 [Auriculariopsis ampla]